MIPLRPSSNVWLVRHPDTRSEFLGELGVRVSWIKDDQITFLYVLTGDLRSIRIPPSQVSRRVSCLWEHTCFEAFVRAKGQSDYYEFNFSPSGEWAAYAFQKYRKGGPIDDDELNPKIAVQKESETLELRAVIRMDRLSKIQLGSTLWLGLSAVVEDINGRLSYWALRHPPGKPDFHHPDNFALEIPLGGQNP